MSQFFAQPSDIDIDRTATDPPPERVERAGKLYTKKRANLPFLKSHKWPAKPPSSKARMVKEGSPPYERASDVSRSILRYSALLVLGTLLLSRMLTQTWAWGYSVNVMKYIPRPVRGYISTLSARPTVCSETIGPFLFVMDRCIRSRKQSYYNIME
jgi:hypothetical protein